MSAKTDRHCSNSNQRVGRGGKKELWKLGLGWRPEKKLKEEQHFWGKGELKEWSFEIPVFPASLASRRIQHSLALWGTKQSLKLSALLAVVPWLPSPSPCVHTNQPVACSKLEPGGRKALQSSGPCWHSALSPLDVRNPKDGVLSRGGSPALLLGKADCCCSTPALTALS